MELSDESTPELEAPLSSIDAPHAAIWMAELLTEMAAINKKHPELDL